MDELIKHWTSFPDIESSEKFKKQYFELTSSFHKIESNGLTLYNFLKIVIAQTSEDIKLRLTIFDKVNKEVIIQLNKDSCANAISEAKNLIAQLSWYGNKR